MPPNIFTYLHSIFGDRVVECLDFSLKLSKFILKGPALLV